MRTGRSWSALLLVAMLATVAPGLAVAASPSPLASPRPGTMSFATPDDAVRHYLAGVSAGDAAMIVEASAVDEMSHGFDFAAQVDRLKAMELTNGLAPAEYPLFADIDRAVVSARILGQAKMLVYSLLTSETLDGSIIVPADRARGDAFVSEVDPSRLAGLSVQDVRYSDAKHENDPRVLENAARQAAIYGADDLTERLALVDLDGQLYEVGFTLLRYGDDWKVSSQAAVLGGTPVLGTAVPTTREEYDQKTSGD